MLKVKAQTQKPKTKLQKQVKTNDVPLKHSKGLVAREHYEIGTFKGDNHYGIRVTGSNFLADVISTLNLVPGGGGTTPALCRTAYLQYLNPQMISSKISKLARAFKHYRFEKVRLEYLPECSTSQTGEVLLGVTQDVSDDPSVLTDRKLRCWYDGLAHSAACLIYGSENKKDMMTPWIDLTAERNFYEVSMNVASPEDAQQSKLFVGLSNTGTVFAGQLKLHYQLVLVDQDETIFDIANDMASGSANNFVFTTPSLSSAGTDVQWVDVPPTFYPNTGVYSIVSALSEGGAQDGKLTKTIRVGVEFILTLTGYPGAATLLYTLYDSLMDFASDNPTESIVASVASFTRSFYAQPLMLDTNSVANPPTSKSLSSHPTWRRLQARYCELIPGHEVHNGCIIPVSEHTVVEDDDKVLTDLIERHRQVQEKHDRITPQVQPQPNPLWLKGNLR